METLKFNDRTLLEGSTILSGDLFLYINGKTMKDVFPLLIEPRKTKKIIYTRNAGDTVEHLGFTQLVALRDEGTGLVTAVLRKGAT